MSSSVDWPAGSIAVPIDQTAGLDGTTIGGAVFYIKCRTKFCSWPLTEMICCPTSRAEDAMFRSAHFWVRAVMTDLVFDQGLAFGRRGIRKAEIQRMVGPMVRTTELRRLLQHWYYLKGDRVLPRRSDLDPADIAYCLGNVALVEIEQPFRPRYRLVGTQLARLLGQDPTGRYIDTMYSAGIRSEALAAYRRTVETGEPDYTERVFSLLFLKFGYYRLLLPFNWRREGQADLVLAAFFQTDRSIRRAIDWLGRVPEQDR